MCLPVGFKIGDRGDRLEIRIDVKHRKGPTPARSRRLVSVLRHQQRRVGASRALLWLGEDAMVAHTAPDDVGVTLPLLRPVLPRGAAVGSPCQLEDSLVSLTLNALDAQARPEPLASAQIFDELISCLAESRLLLGGEAHPVAQELLRNVEGRHRGNP